MIFIGGGGAEELAPKNVASDILILSKKGLFKKVCLIFRFLQKKKKVCFSGMPEKQVCFAGDLLLPNPHKYRMAAPLHEV